MKQKEFARADYEGLSKEGQKYLRAKRNYFAQELYTKQSLKTYQWKHQR